jgi:hypothetical protein
LDESAIVDGTASDSSRLNPEAGGGARERSRGAFTGRDDDDDDKDADDTGKEGVAAIDGDCLDGACNSSDGVDSVFEVKVLAGDCISDKVELDFPKAFDTGNVI